MNSNLESICKQLEMELSNSTQMKSTLESISPILTKWGLPGVTKTIQKLVEENAWLEKVAKKSHFQGNGFYKIVLFQNDIFSLRLHLYLPHNRAQENLHSHRWPFVSTILTGTLSSEVWIDSIRPDCDSYDEYLYVGKDKAIIKIGRAKVEIAEELTFNESESYITYPDQLHRVAKVSNEMTATLMVRPNQCRSWARNIVVNNRIPDTVPEYLSAEALADILNEFLDITNDRQGLTQ